MKTRLTAACVSLSLILAPFAEPAAAVAQSAAPTAPANISEAAAEQLLPQTCRARPETPGFHPPDRLRRKSDACTDPASAASGQIRIPNAAAKAPVVGERLAQLPNVDANRLFDGSQGRSAAGPVVPVGAVAAAPAGGDSGVPSTRASIATRSGSAASKNLDAGTPVPVPAPAPTAAGRPPDNFKGRVARVLGAFGGGSALGAVADVFWGPAAAAYYVAGSAFKSIQYNADVLGRGGRLANALGGNSTMIRFLAGFGLTMGGTFTGNPLVTYFGITFLALSAGEALGKGIFSGTNRLLSTSGAERVGGKIDGALGKAVERLRPKKETAWGTDSPPPSKMKAFLAKAGRALYLRRKEIAKTAIATAVSMAAMTGIARGTESVMNNAAGTMAPATGRLTLTDKIRNSVIGAYRLYNLPVAAYQGGPQTRKFYLDMKAKYNPKSPEDWANIVENNITWTNHAELYGTNMYYVSSEEAATFRSYNGAMGYYSDCTGKGALLANMLKMDGYGPSQIVVGVPPLGRAGEEGHIWIINPNASDPQHELFHYSNTRDLLYSQKLTGAEGIKGDRTAAFAAGGIGGALTDLVYKGLDAAGRRIGPLRDRDAAAAPAASNQAPN